MNALMTKYASLGFIVLGFPCNSFGNLEPYDTYSELLNGLMYVRPGGGFVPKFPLFKKIEVNGKNEHPLYKYIKGECAPTNEEFEDGLFYSPLAVHDVRWNYEVFVINQKGLPEFRYSEDHPIAEIEADVKALLTRNLVEINEYVEPQPILSDKILRNQEPEVEENTNEIPEEEMYYPDVEVPQM
ncbi:hypothetical protein ACF0H5_009443 [Mactra antiquata]